MPINSSEARKAGLVQLYDWDRATADVHTARGNVQFETWLIEEKGRIERSGRRAEIVTDGDRHCRRLALFVQPVVG